MIRKITRWWWVPFAFAFIFFLFYLQAVHDRPSWLEIGLRIIDLDFTLIEDIIDSNNSVARWNALWVLSAQIGGLLGVVHLVLILRDRMKESDSSTSAADPSPDLIESKTDGFSESVRGGDEAHNKAE